MADLKSLKTGLVSVTFRGLPVTDVIELVKSAGLDAIEWGGDVHVPPGDLAAARAAKAGGDAASLAVAAYGSYYRAGTTPPQEFDAVLASAAALGAPTIRIWAGNVGSANADGAHFDRTVADIVRVADRAAAESITITIEYHGWTLTDTFDATLKLLRAINHPNVRTGWQPRDGMSPDGGAAELRALQPWLGNVHVFQWWPTTKERHPLADGAARWERYLSAAAADGRPRFALLEFVKGDSAEQFRDDAATLKRLLGR